MERTNFVMVNTQEEADVILKDYVFLDDGVDEVLIARSDIARAIALIPPSIDAKFIDTKVGLEPIVTTFGCFINRCNLESPLKEQLIQKVIEYQTTADNLEPVKYIHEESEFYKE